MRKLFFVMAFLAALSFPRGVLAQQPIRVNCGGPSYTDSKGQVWQADTGFTGGTEETIAGSVAGTADPLLYEDYRWDPTSYSFSVPNGVFQVKLHFTEANPKAEMASARVFSVSLQGTTTFANLDIFAEVGANTALIKSANISVTEGHVAIGFTPVAGLSPKVSAIEILPLPTATSPTLGLNFKYPDGTPVAGTLNYSVSSTLLSFKGSAPLANGQAQCLLFSNPLTMGISAQFTVNLSLTDTAGHTLWQFTVAMDPSQVNLGAVHSSALNVVVQKL